MSEKVNWNFVVEEDYPNPSECKTIIAWSDMSKKPYYFDCRKFRRSLWLYVVRLKWT